MSRFCLEFYDHTEMIFVQIVNIGSVHMLCNEFLSPLYFLGMIGVSYTLLMQSLISCSDPLLMIISASGNKFFWNPFSVCLTRTSCITPAILSSFHRCSNVLGRHSQSERVY